MQIVWNAWDLNTIIIKKDITSPKMSSFAYLIGLNPILSLAFV